MTCQATSDALSHVDAITTDIRRLKALAERAGIDDALEILCMQFNNGAMELGLFHEARYVAVPGNARLVQIRDSGCGGAWHKNPGYHVVQVSASSVGLAVAARWLRGQMLNAVTP